MHLPIFDAHSNVIGSAVFYNETINELLMEDTLRIGGMYVKDLEGKKILGYLVTPTPSKPSTEHHGDQTISKVHDAIEDAIASWDPDSTIRDKAAFVFSQLQNAGILFRERS